MIYDFDFCFDKLMQAEGGYVNNARDSGGATNFGITIGSLSDIRKYPVSIQDVKALTLTESKIIYKSRFWDSLNLTDFTKSPLAYLLFDQHVNRGSSPTVKCLQKALGVTPDGILGSVTANTILNITSELEIKSLCLEFIKECQLSYCRIAVKDSKNLDFLVGWITRTHHLIELVEDFNL